MAVRIDQIKDPRKRMICKWVLAKLGDDQYRIIKEYFKNGTMPITGKAIVRYYRQANKYTPRDATFHAERRKAIMRQRHDDYFAMNREKFMAIVPEGKAVGYEAECCFKSISDRFFFMKKMERLGAYSSISFVRDGSVNADERGGVGGNEIRICCAFDKMDEVMKPILDALKEHAYVNDTCGGHVHFDMRHLDINAVIPMGQRLQLARNALALVCAEKRRTNSYTKLMYDSNYNYAPISSSQMAACNRYMAINWSAYAKHKTLEVRLFEGCLDYKRVKEWIVLNAKVMSTKIKQEINSLKELSELVGSDEIQALTEGVA